MLYRIIDILGFPIMVLNYGAEIVAGIWLAVLGEWKLIGIGILFLVTSHYLLSILMMLSLPVSAIAVRYIEKKNPLGYLFGFLSQFYTNFTAVR